MDKITRKLTKLCKEVKDNPHFKCLHCGELLILTDIEQYKNEIKVFCKPCKCKKPKLKNIA